VVVSQLHFGTLMPSVLEALNRAHLPEGRAVSIPSGSKFACRLGFLGNIRNSEHIVAGRSSPVLVPNEKIVQFHIIAAIRPFVCGHGPLQKPDDVAGWDLA